MLLHLIFQSIICLRNVARRPQMVGHLTELPNGGTRLQSGPQSIAKSSYSTTQNAVKS